MMNGDFLTLRSAAFATNGTVPLANGAPFPSSGTGTSAPFAAPAFNTSPGFPATAFPGGTGFPSSGFAATNPSPLDPALRLVATTVFAFHCAEGVLMAGDHRATAGNTVFSDHTEKILALDRFSLLAIAGSPAVAFEMARTLQTSFEFYRRSQLQPLSLPAKLRALSRLLRENLPGTLQGFGVVAPLFAGVDASGRPGIYFYDPLGAEFASTTFAASGSGSGSVKSILHFQEKWGPRPAELALPAAANLANRLLLTAAEFDTATGGVDPDRGEFATLKLLRADGVHPVSTADQARYWQEAAR